MLLEQSKRAVPAPTIEQPIKVKLLSARRTILYVIPYTVKKRAVPAPTTEQPIKVKLLSARRTILYTIPYTVKKRLPAASLFAFILFCI